MTNAVASYLPLFPGLTDDVVTGIQVYVNVVDKSGNAIELQIEDCRPDISVAEFNELYGDGMYRIEAVSNGGGSKPETLESRSYPVAKKLPSRWKSAVREVLLNSGNDLKNEASDSEADPDSESDGFDPMGSLRDRDRDRDIPGRGGPRDGSSFPSRFSSMRREMDPQDPYSGRESPPPGSPYTVQITKDFSVPLASGLPAEKQQEILDEARKMAREDLKETSVTQLLMMMMKQQTDDAKADAKFFREMAVSGSSMGGAPRRDPQNEAYDQVVSSLKRENEHLEQQLRKVRNDAEDDMRRIRNNAESDARAARQRIDDLEKDLANTRQEVHRLTGDLQKAKIEADVQKMMSSSGLKESGGDMEKKMAMIKSIIESIGPVALPLLGQIMSSMGGAAPGMPPGDMSGGSLPQT